MGQFPQQVLVLYEGRIEMRKRMPWSVVLVLGAVVGLAAGCDAKHPSPEKGAASATPEPHLTGVVTKNGHDEHDHPTTGPHQGTLVELGNEQYHAEVVHDEKAGSVTIYILDHTAKKAVAIKADEIVINLKHHGKGEQFKLAAAPDKGDTSGSSRFQSEDKELSEDLDVEGAEARVVIEIGGKSYSGELKHIHDNDHDHDRHGEKGHGHSDK